MSGRDWDKELKKIDKHLSSISDDELLARNAPPAANTPKGRTAPVADNGGARPPSPLGVAIRVGLALALAIGIHFWPYSARCGFGLAGYLASVTVVIASGSWAAISTWRARAGRAHLLALLVVTWGIALAAVEVLPRIGYAKDPARVAWICK
jgi:hypothetical protein